MLRRSSLQSYLIIIQEICEICIFFINEKLISPSKIRFKLLNRDLSISKFHTNFETNILFKVHSHFIHDSTSTLIIKKTWLLEKIEYDYAR